MATLVHLYALAQHAIQLHNDLNPDMGRTAVPGIEGIWFSTADLGFGTLMVMLCIAYSCKGTIWENY